MCLNNFLILKNFLIDYSIRYYLKFKFMSIQFLFDLKISNLSLYSNFIIIIFN